MPHVTFSESAWQFSRFTLVRFDLNDGFQGGRLASTSPCCVCSLPPLSP